MLVNKKRIKRIAFFSLVLSSMAVNAATMMVPQAQPLPAYDPFRVFVPDLKPGFELNAGAIWLKPGASNLNYVIFNKELPTQTPSWTEREIRPGYNTAFQLGLRYVVPCKGEDISLNWIHLNTNDSARIGADDSAHFLGPDYEIGPDGLTIRHSTGNAKFKYDVVNLDVGQFVNFGPCLTMRFFGGLSSGFLREQLLSTYSGTTTGLHAGPFSTSQNVYSNFTGFGPRAGMSADYPTRWGIGFIGEAGLSALIGSLYSKTSYTSSSQELLDIYHQTNNKQYIKDQSVCQVVPGIDAKLGMNYKHTFRDVLFTVSAGYQAAVYINAVSQYLPGTQVAGQDIQSGGIFVATMNHTLSNYSVQGPFLNFSIQA